MGDKTNMNIKVETFMIPIKLNDKSWNQWSTYVTHHLTRRSQINHLTDNPSDPITTEWKVIDSDILCTLWGAMKPEIYSVAMTCQTAKALWDHLVATYSGSSSMSHAYTVSQAYSRCTQGSRSISEYYTHFKKLADELEECFPLSSDPQALRKRQDKLHVLTFIGGLSSAHDSIRPMLLGHSGTNSIQSTYSLLREMFIDSAPSNGTPDSSALAVGRGIGRNFGNLSSSHHAVSEAQAHPGWRKAMHEEMSALEANSTWDLVDLPAGKEVVGCKWVFSIKMNPDGSLARLKARLVAKGYSQTYGEDYYETFSPVAKMTSVRFIIAQAASHHWPLHQLDIKNAFLNAILEEEVYMQQPPGFVVEEESTKVCRLRRSLYGLKQAPRVWFSRFSQALEAFGMTRSTCDYSVFFRHQRGKRIILVFYVDDIVITGDDQEGILALKTFIQKEFRTKDLGNLKYFLGIEVARSNKGIFLCQRKYVLDILAETGMLDSRDTDSPMIPNIKLYPDEGELLQDPGRYRRLVGKLNYLIVTTQDISFSVGVVSQFMSSTRTSHWDAVLHILRYLKSAPGKGLLYTDQGHTRIAGYSDASHAACPYSRRSTTGYCVLFGGNVVSWKSKKQDIVSLSSAESEYRAMARTACELTWIRRLAQELDDHTNELMDMYCDNEAASHISKNQIFHERTKHSEVDCLFVREKVVGTSREPPTINPVWVSSGDELADVLTKPLRGSQINPICSKLGMHDIYAPT